MSIRFLHFNAYAFAALVTSVALPSLANPRPLPFSYIYETLPEGQTEIEQYVDMTPVRAISVSGDRVWYGATQFQTEFEYGITDRLELGLYVAYAPSNPAYALTPRLADGNGMKQRLRYRFAEAGEWPIDVALYGELAENEREIELEAKVILQRRIGPVRLVANAWAEREFYYDGEQEWVLHPTLGAVLDLDARVQPGIEYWMRAELSDEDEPKSFNQGPMHYAGPTLMLQFGRLWWTTGAYLRFNDTHRTAMPGDDFGKYWVRTIVGIGL
jgi:hypothetical protein